MQKKKGSVRVFSQVLAACVIAGALVMVASSCGGGTTTTTESEATAPRTTATTAPRTTPSTTAPAATTAQGLTFKAILKSDEEVPALTTTATGEAEFTLSADGQSLKFKVTVANISDATASHIHIAAAGSNGPIAVPLFSGSKAGLFSGTLAEGTITAADLTGPLAGMTLNDLISQMKSGNAYCNVHTTAHAAGEIRGQIK